MVVKILYSLVVIGLTGALLTPSGAESQLPARESPRVGILTFRPIPGTFQEAFRQGLRDHGYVEGRIDRVNALAQELVRLKVDVIVAEFTPSAQAAKNATQTIPIVMAPAGDPVAAGLVSSLARPGGNITGFSDIAVELSGKRLELIRELVPGLTRVGLLVHGADPLDKKFVDETQAAAAKRGIHLQVVGVPSPAQLDQAFSTLMQERVGAVIVQANVPVPAARITQLALRHRLPSISLLNQFVEAGGLMSYGANLSEIQRRAAGHIHRILKGAKPAELPVERPTRFEFVINRKTARALGLSIPQSVLLQADQVIDP
jgi:putative tryptophan/tyrosine transport system substrate-binding protein